VHEHREQDTANHLSQAHQEDRHAHTCGAIPGKLTALCQQIAETQAEKIDRACALIAEEIGKGKLVYAWGTGGHDNRSPRTALACRGSCLRRSDPGPGTFIDARGNQGDQD